MAQNAVPDKNIKFSLSGFLKHNFLAGVAILFPLVVTGYFVFFVFDLADQLTGRYINVFFRARYGYTIPGLGIGIALAAVFLCGLVYNYFFGRKVFSFLEKLFRRMPLIGNIYPSVKQLSDFMFTRKEARDFQKTVLVEFPAPGSYAVGFVTNKNIAQFDKAAAAELVCVFIPLAPAPFSGHIIAVEKNKLRELDIPIDAAIRFIMSGGVAFSVQRGGDEV